MSFYARPVHEAHPGRPLARAAVVVVLLALASGLPAPASAQESTLPAKLREGGAVFLKNDLQAAREAMSVFRSFRRELRRQIDIFEEVDSEEEADLIVVLSGDPDIVRNSGIVNRGIPFPSGYTSTKAMFLVIYDAATDELLWFDGVNWETRGLATQVDSHERLVVNLKAALSQ